jgi:hypothetical protein
MSRFAEGARAFGTGVIVVLGLLMELGFAVLGFYVLFHHGPWPSPSSFPCSFG